MIELNYPTTRIQRPVDFTWAGNVAHFGQSRQNAANAVAGREESAAEAIRVLAQVMVNDKKERSLQSRVTFWVSVLAPLITLFGILLTNWSSHNLEKHRDLIERNYQQAQVLQVEVDNEEKTADAVNEAMISIRSYRDFSRGSCQAGVYIGDQEQLLRESRQRVYNLVQANYAVDRHFDKPIFNEVSLFINKVDQDSNLCAADSPSDEALREIQRSFNVKADTTIKDKKQKIIALKNQL